MRRTMLLSAMGLFLLVSGCHAQAKTQKRAAPAPSQAAVRPNPSWTVEGLSSTPEEALQDALEKARDKVGSYLAQQSPPIDWRPDVKFVREHLLGSLPKGDDGTYVEIDKKIVRQEEQPLHGVERVVYRVTVLVEVTPTSREKMRQEEQSHQSKQRIVRAEKRQAMAVRLLAGVVGILAAVAGYLRLEDATKGYYTTLLRLAAATFLSMVGAGIWLFS